MNLKTQYKRLFEARVSSNDAELLRENNKDKKLKLYDNSTMKHVHTFENFNSSVNEGEFWRLPKNAATGNDFYIAQKNLQLIYDAVKNGQNFDMDMFDKTLQTLEKIKKQAKKFQNDEDIKGTSWKMEWWCTGTIIQL